MCGGACSYLNGAKAVITIQLLAFTGMMFSIGSLFDCSFVELGQRFFLPEDMDENLPLKVTQTQYIGFLNWKMLDGSCYWYTSGSDPEIQLETYWDLVGKDWEMIRIVAMLGTCLSFVFFCYLLSFSCSSQVRGVRYFNTVFLSVVLTTLQSMPFLVFGSELCDDYGCTFSRSASLSVVAMGCFFSSGLCFFLTTDYPGPLWDKKTPRFLTTTGQIATEQIPDSDRDLVFEDTDDGNNENNEYDYNNNIIMPEMDNVVQEYDVEEVVLDDQGDGGTEDGDVLIVEEVIEDDEGNGNDVFNTMSQLNAGDDVEVVTEITDNEVRVVESITHADGTSTVTKTTEQIAGADGDENKNEGEDFNGLHPDVGAGDDFDVYTEVTEEEVKVVETITHVDGSQNVTETYEEVVQ